MTSAIVAENGHLKRRLLINGAKIFLGKNYPITASLTWAVAGALFYLGAAILMAPAAAVICMATSVVLMSAGVLQVRHGRYFKSSLAVPMIYEATQRQLRQTAPASLRFQNPHEARSMPSNKNPQSTMCRDPRQNER